GRWWRWGWWWWRWRRLRHRGRRGAILPFARAGDGIRARSVTGVQTCALPICDGRTAARPRDRAPSERVAARVPRGRGELHGLIHLDRRRGRRDVEGGERRRLSASHVRRR